MWISVDRYLAVRKPLRYETVQTKTRKASTIVGSNPFLNLRFLFRMPVLDVFHMDLSSYALLPNTVDGREGDQRSIQFYLYAELGPNGCLLRHIR